MTPKLGLTFIGVFISDVKSEKVLPTLINTSIHCLWFQSWLNGFVSMITET